METAGGVVVKGVWASQVERLRLHHQVPDIEPQEFDLMPQQQYFVADWPIPRSLRLPGASKTTEKVPMKGTQLQIVRNSATTVFKLQGKTVQSIFVYEWSSIVNYAYVVLSRA